MLLCRDVANTKCWRRNCDAFNGMAFARMHPCAIKKSFLSAIYLFRLWRERCKGSFDVVLLIFKPIYWKRWERNILVYFGFVKAPKATGDLFSPTDVVLWWSKGNNCPNFAETWGCFLENLMLLLKSNTIQLWSLYFLLSTHKTTFWNKVSRPRRIFLQFGVYSERSSSQAKHCPHMLLEHQLIF